jgi:Flp pilus assembly protein TadG
MREKNQKLKEAFTKGEKGAAMIEIVVGAVMLIIGIYIIIVLIKDLIIPLILGH